VTRISGAELRARDIRALERMRLLLERGTWPTGLPITDAERTVIQANRDILARYLARREAAR
jgi:hypothetical protein